MENASKALIIAAGVLLGIMIISVGVVLFRSLGSSGAEIMGYIERVQVAEFNNQFYKYYGKVTNYNETTKQYEESTIKVTSHDIVSIANLAQKNNIQYEVQNETGKSDNTNYVQVDVVGYLTKLETKTEKELSDFLKNNIQTGNETKYFACSNIQTSYRTGRVIYIEFKDYDKVK